MNIVSGDQIGPYVILRPLGQGGMGQVFLADDSRLHRKVALKYLFSPSGPEATLRASLLREAEAVARITHPHVAIVYDIIEQPDGAFIVMEYVEGETLSDRLARERLPIAVVTEFGRQLASALAAAHLRGIIHRDLKPSNIQVTPEGTVKILDFGVAKVCELLSATAMTVAATLPTNTQTTPIGTLGYMSPEQLLGHSVGPASDLFSLGVVMFEMATGQRLFGVPDVGQILERMSKTLPRVHEVNAKVPLQLSDVIARMLEIDTGKRVQAAADVETRLRALSQSNATSSGTLGDAAGDSALQDLRKKLILAQGQSEIVRLRYELERYLAERPHDVDGRVLKDDVERALLVGPTQGPLTPVSVRRRVTPVWGVAGAAVIVALAVWVLGYRTFWKTGSIGDQVAVTTTGPPATSPSPAAAAPTPEEVFQDHYGRAQALIQQGNQESARQENTLALAALPEDPRGVVQRRAIERMPDPSAAQAPPVTADRPAPPAAASPKPAAPPLAETLRVAARQGEPEKERATREKTARSQLEEGRKALADRQFDTAIEKLQSAIATSGRGDYGVQANEASSMLRQARNSKVAADVNQRHANAQRLVEEAKAAAGSDIVTALQKLREARNLDPEVEGANEFNATLTEQARVQGEAAITSAKNYEARSRTDQAIKEYERAVWLLEFVPGHKDLALARKRLAQLKGGK